MLHIWLLFVNVFKPLGVTILVIHFLYCILMGCNLLAISRKIIKISESTDVFLEM